MKFQLENGYYLHLYVTDEMNKFRSNTFDKIHFLKLLLYTNLKQTLFDIRDGHLSCN